MKQRPYVKVIPLCFLIAFTSINADIYDLFLSAEFQEKVKAVFPKDPKKLPLQAQYQLSKKIMAMHPDAFFPVLLTKPQRVFTELSDEPESIAISPDNTKVALESKNYGASVWEIATGRRLLKTSGDTEYLKFSADGSQLLAIDYNNRTGKVWSLVRKGPTFPGDLVFSLPEHGGSLNSLYYNHDSSKMVSSATDKLARIFDGKTGELLHSLPHDSDVTSARFNNDGTKIITIDSGWIHGEEGQEEHGPPSQEEVGPSLAKIWHTETGEHIHTLAGHEKLENAEFNHDGTQALTFSENKVIIWDVNTGTIKYTIGEEEAEEGFSDAFFSPKEPLFFTISQEEESPDITQGIIKIWNARNGRMISTLKGQKAPSDYEPIETAKISSNGRYLATGGPSFPPQRTFIWDIPTRVLLFDILGHKDDITAITFSSNNKLVATASDDSTAQIWNLEEPWLHDYVEKKQLTLEQALLLLLMQKEKQQKTFISFAQIAQQNPQVTKDELKDIFKSLPEQIQTSFINRYDIREMVELKSNEGENVFFSKDAARFAKLMKDLLQELPEGEVLPSFKFNTPELKEVVSYIERIVTEYKKHIPNFAENFNEEVRKQYQEKVITVLKEELIQRIAERSLSVADLIRLINKFVYFLVEEASQAAHVTIAPFINWESLKKDPWYQIPLEINELIAHHIVRRKPKAFYPLHIDRPSYSLQAHVEEITGISLSPNRRRMLTISPEDATAVKLWDTKKKALLFSAPRLSEEDGAFKQASMDTKGDKILVAYGNKLFVYETQTGSLLFQLPYPERFVTKAHFSHDGTKIVVVVEQVVEEARHDRVEIRNAETGEEIASFEYIGVEDALFTAADTKIFAYAPTNCKLWDIAGKEPTFTSPTEGLGLPVPSEPAKQPFIISPNAEKILQLFEGIIAGWNVSDSSRIEIEQVHEVDAELTWAAARWAHFMKDSKKVIAHFKGLPFYIKAAITSYEPIQEGPKPQMVLTISNDATKIAYTVQGRRGREPASEKLQVWDLSSKVKGATIEIDTREENIPSAASFTTDNTFIAIGSKNGLIQIFNISTPWAKWIDFYLKGDRFTILQAFFLTHLHGQKVERRPLRLQRHEHLSIEEQENIFYSFSLPIRRSIIKNFNLMIPEKRKREEPEKILPSIRYLEEGYPIGLKAPNRRNKPRRYARKQT